MAAPTVREAGHTETTDKFVAVPKQRLLTFLREAFRLAVDDFRNWQKMVRIYMHLSLYMYIYV